MELSRKVFVNKCIYEQSGMEVHKSKNDFVHNDSIYMDHCIKSNVRTCFVLGITIRFTISSHSRAEHSSIKCSSILISRHPRQHAFLKAYFVYFLLIVQDLEDVTLSTFK